MSDVAQTFAAAERAFAGGDPVAAVRLLAGLDGRVAPDPSVYHLRALALKRIGRLDEARAAFDTAHQLAPRDAQIANNYANLLNQLGDAEPALALYDRALALQPSYRDARFNKALLLKRLGRMDEALAILTAISAANPQDARAQSARGSLLLTLGRHEEAAAAFDRALTAQPQLPTALAGRAKVALERGEDGTVERFRRAQALDPANLDLLYGVAEALEVEGSSDGMALLARAVAARPDWIAGHERLARMRAEAGEQDFAGHYRKALRQAPGNAELRHSLARVLAQADRHAEALEALAPLPDDSQLIVTRAFYHGEAGEAAAGLRLLDSFDHAAQQADVALMRGRLLLAVGDVAGAVTALERAVALAPDSVNAWAHIELAWRTAGDPRSEWLSGQPGLYGVRDIGLAAEELQETAALLRNLHRTRAHPIGQSLRGGTQTRGRLFLRREPELARLHGALDEAIRAHMAALPPADPDHPLLRHRDSAMRIAGSWSVRLTSQGFHVQHIHPEGVLSSACYLGLPPGIGEDAERSGWLELGRPPANLKLPLGPLATIEPRPGRLALFPSFLFHGTRPFAEGERLTVAFDVVPA